MAGGNGHNQDFVDMSDLLVEISARLVTVGSVTMPQPPEPVRPDVERLQIISFVLGETRYALPIDHVSEVIRRPQITPVPGLPSWLLGVTNLHGDIISVVDLVHFLELGDPVLSSYATMIVATAADQRIGLLVDDIGLIYTFPGDEIMSPPFKVTPGLVAYLQGTVDRNDSLVRVLNCKNLLLGQKMQQFS